MAVTIPVRRDRFDLAGFAAWLAEEGAEVGHPSNPYEVIRYRAFWQGSTKALTHIVYAKSGGLLTYTGGSRSHYEAFLASDVMPENEPTVEEKRVRRLNKTGPVRVKLRQRDGDCCWFCGGLLESAESNIEHLIPISQGGTNALANLVLTHTACNTKAGNLNVAKKLELRAKLHTAQSTEEPKP